MRSRLASLLLPVGLLLSMGAVSGQRRREEEPKPQILPLAPEPPMALAAKTETLDFHISPLLKTGGLSSQIRQSLNNLIRDTRGEKIVKLRAFVAGTGDARRVQSLVTALFSEHKLPLPVLSILQVGALGDRAEQVVIEAVVATPRAVNPAGLAFFFGQSGTNLTRAIEHLKKNTASVGVSGDSVLSLTCFTSQIADFASDSTAIKNSFPKTALNLVQAVRDPLSNYTNCEAVAQLGTKPSEPVQRIASANATLVDAGELVFTGLQLSFGSYLDDAREAFERLRRSAQALNGNTPVMVDGFSLDPYAASALRKRNSLAPGVFTVHTVEGLSAIDATGGIEAVLATGAEKP